MGQNQLPFCLSIAGSDSSGGAGVAADLRAFGGLGVRAACVFTALTVQDTDGVHAINPVPADVVAQQFRALARAVPVAAVKVGMLVGSETVLAVADVLVEYGDGPVVVDPVMVSTSGTALITDEALELLDERLLPMATLVTPNIPEAEHFLGRRLADVEAAAAAAEELSARWGAAVLVKGGHLDTDEVVDVLCADGGTILMGSRRLEGVVRGTGCMLSSAVAAGLANGRNMAEAVRAGNEYVQEVWVRLTPNA